MARTVAEVSHSPAAEKKRGLRGRIAENKKEELTDYMKQAVQLVKTYVPPKPAKIQAAKDAGNVSIEILVPGKRARLIFRNYELPGGFAGRGGGSRQPSRAGLQCGLVHR